MKKLTYKTKITTNNIHKYSNDLMNHINYLLSRKYYGYVLHYKLDVDDTSQNIYLAIFEALSKGNYDYISIEHIPQFIFSAVRKGISKVKTFSFENIIDYDFEADDYIYLKNIIPEQVNSISYFENNMLSLQLYSELKNILDKKEYNVISLRFGLENDAPNKVYYSQQELSWILGLSRSAISRIEK